MSTLLVDNIIPFTSGSTTITLAATLDTTASYALTASYAMNGGGGGGTPGGSDTQIQFNSGSTFGVSDHFEYKYVSESLEQGYAVQALGGYSHAEGDGTDAIGFASHAEGTNTVAIGGYSHAEGSQTIAGFKAILVDSVSNGLITISDDVDYSSAFNSGRVLLSNGQVYTYNAINFNSPDFTIQLDNTSVNSTLWVVDPNVPNSSLAGYSNFNGGQHAEGAFSYALGNSSHAEGIGTRAVGDYSHTEGQGAQAIGNSSHAAGYMTKAIGFASQAIGGYSQALGEKSNAEGEITLTGYRGVVIDSCVNGLITISDNVDYSSIFGTGQNRLLIGNFGLFSVDSISYNAPDFTIQLSDRTLNIGGGGQWVVDVNYPNSPLAGYLFTGGGYGAHAEGYFTKAIGNYSHAEGEQTQAIGYASHAAGFQTKAAGAYSQAIGGYAQAVGIYSHAEGTGTATVAYASHAEGNNTTAGYRNLRVDSIVNGLITISNDVDYSSYFNTGRIVYNDQVYTYNSTNFSSPDYTIQLDDTSVNDSNFFIFVFNPDQPNAQLSGYSQTGGSYSHAEGDNTKAIGVGSHAEGFITKAIGGYSHAEGGFTQAIGIYSHAEGEGTQAIGGYSHAEGYYTEASGLGSHAEGISTTASGQYSHAEGTNTTAIGLGSHAEGIGTIASGSYQLAIGGYNVSDNTSTFVIGGGGTLVSKRTAARFVQFDSSAEQNPASANTTGSWVLTQVSESLDFANDTAAAAAGVPLGGLYHSSGTIKIRLV